MTKPVPYEAMSHNIKVIHARDDKLLPALIGKRWDDLATHQQWSGWRLQVRRKIYLEGEQRVVRKERRKS